MGRIYLSHGMGYTWVTDKSHYGHWLDCRRVIDKPHMGLRWITGLVIDGSKVHLAWMTYESHIGYTSEYISHLLFQTYRSLIPSKPYHTSGTKNVCNLRSIRRK